MIIQYQLLFLHTDKAALMVANEGKMCSSCRLSFLLTIKTVLMVKYSSVVPKHWDHGWSSS